MTNVSKDKRVAIYVRISDDAEGTGKGVDAQEADCRKRATIAGWQVVKVYRENDVGASRHSKKPRPEYKAMLESAYNGELDVILAYSNSRLTRRLREFLDLIDLYETTGVLICTCVSGDDDLSTADGRMVAKIKASVDEAEADKISERVTRRIADKVAAGEWLGGARPFGWGYTDWSTDDTGKQLRRDHDIDKLNELEAQMIREGADHVLSGGSVGELIRRWNGAGVTTARGASWRHSAINQMLCRWRNAGVYEYHGQPKFDVSTTWQTVLTVDEVKRLRALLTDPKRARANSYAVKHQLAGIARCECGSKMMSGAIHSRGRVYPIYKCHGQNCSKAIGISKLDALVDDFVVSTYLNNGGKGFSQPKDAALVISEVRAKLADVLTERSELESGISEGLISYKGVKDRLTELKDSEAALRAHEQRALSDDAHAALVDLAEGGIRPGKANIKAAADRKAELAKSWAAMPIESRRRVLKALFQIVVGPGRDLSRVKMVGPAPWSMAEES